jgi:hypothetical protein
MREPAILPQFSHLAMQNLLLARFVATTEENTVVIALRNQALIMAALYIIETLS